MTHRTLALALALALARALALHHLTGWTGTVVPHTPVALVCHPLWMQAVVMLVMMIVENPCCV